MTLPKLTPEEKMQALKKAQEMRSERAKIRQRLKAGEITLDELLGRADEEVIGKMRVAYLLQSLPRVGRVTSQRLMEEIGIDESRRVQGLGKRQLTELLAKLG